MIATIAGLPVKRTKDIINSDTKICTMVYAPPKSGKTTMGATMHQYCLETYNKPALFIACEPSDGGGVSAIQNWDAPFVQPNDLTTFEATLRYLQTDTEFAAVICDNFSDVVKNTVQPFALKYPSREGIPTRAAGVPERSDYQTIGEKSRQLLNLMIALTKIDPKYRKHLIVNTLREEKKDNAGNIIGIGPDLPGALAQAGPAVFELVATIEVKTRPVPSPDNPKQMMLQKQYTFVTSADGVKLAGDRYNVFPANGPADWGVLMREYWEPRMAQYKLGENK